MEETAKKPGGKREGQKYKSLLVWDIVPFKPVEKHSQITNVIVDGGDTDRLSEVSASLWIVLYLGEIIHKEGVFSSLLEVIDVLANHVLCDLVDAINFKFVAQPSLE